jgi:hypothetical protein
MLLLCAHGFGLAGLLGWGALLGDHLLIEDDWALHTGNALAARQLWLESGSVFGWRSDLLGGFPAGTIDSAGNKVVELTTAVLGLAPAGRVIAWTAWVLLTLVPVLSGWFTATLVPSLIRHRFLVASVFCALSWTFVDGPRSYIAWGMYAHACSVPLAILAGVLAWRLACQPTPALALALTGVCAAGWELHLLFPLVAGPSLLAGVVTAVAEGNTHLGRLCKWFGAVGVAVFLLALRWLPAFWTDLQFAREIEPVVLANTFRAGATALAQPSVLIVALAIVAAVAGPRRESSLVWCFGLPLLAHALMGVCGELWSPLRHLTPVRLLDVALFSAAPLAVLAARDVRSHLARWLAPATLLAAVIPAFPIWAQTVTGANPLLFWSESAPDPRLPRDMASVVEVLRRETRPPELVLVEDDLNGSGATGIWEQTHFPALLPLLIDRATIGGPFSDSRLVQHDRFSFVAGRAFGTELAALDDAELAGLLQRHRVAWIVSFDPSLRSAFDRVAQREATLDRVIIWRFPR